MAAKVLAHADAAHGEGRGAGAGRAGGAGRARTSTTSFASSMRRPRISFWDLESLRIWYWAKISATYASK